MNFYEEYASQAKQYAIFPVDLSVPYTALGLSGEIGELIPEFIEAFTGGTYDEAHFRDEQGDTWWYIAGVADALMVDFAAMCIPEVTGEHHWKDILKMLSNGVAAINGAAKKSIRDDHGVLTTERAIKMVIGLQDIIWAMKAMNPDYRKVMTANLNKLESRKRRGVIQGDGDNR